MWSPVRPKFASHFNSFLAKHWILQPQKRFCFKMSRKFLAHKCGANLFVNYHMNTTTTFQMCRNFLSFKMDRTSGHELLKWKVTWKAVMLPSIIIRFTDRCRMLGSTPKNAISFAISANEPRRGKLMTSKSAVPWSHVNSSLRNFSTLSVCRETVHLYFTFRDFLNP